MESVKEDKLLQNEKLFISLIRNETTEVKTENIMIWLNGGADVNKRFENYCNNTPLHIAVEKEEKNIVKLLLEQGADVTLKNNEGKTALDVAKYLNTDTGRIIIEIIQVFDKKLQEQYKIIEFLKNVNTDTTVETIKLSLLQKRPSITDVNGESYETKLLSLIFIRTLLNQRIDNFYLCTRVQDIGAFNYICLRYRENNKESIVFLQPKDTVKKNITLNDLWNSSGDYSLSKYFNSYLNIRNKFESTTNDSIFQGRYEDMKCHFIIYTTAEDYIWGKTIRNEYSVDKTVREILSTGENYYIFQYEYDDREIKLLAKNILVDRLKQVGKKLYQYTQENKYKNILCDKHLSSYHVLLVNTVIHISATAVDGTRMGRFREEFLSSSNELLIAIREAFFKEAVKNTNIRLEHLVKVIQLCLHEPSVVNISKLLQIVPTSYDLKNNRLDILNNNIEEVFLSSIHISTISHTTYGEAFQIAVKETLDSFYFKLPLTFGNVDVNVNEFDVENTINNFTIRIENILSQFGDKKIIINNKNEITSSLIGNLLVFDEHSGMFKFNTHAESLGQNATNILNKLKMKINDLDAYKFKFNIDNIPKTSFEADEYDNSIVTDFLNNLWFYSQQVKEHEIEVCAKHNLVDYYNNKQKSHNTFSQLQSDVVFLKIHNVVQKWWLLNTSQAHYVSNYMQIFDEHLIDSTGNTVLSMFNHVYVNEIRKLGIDFKEQAIQSLGLDTLTGFTIIETANKTLTAIKLYQYFSQMNNYTFIDFNYISRLSLQDGQIMIKELEKNNKGTIIMIYEHISNEVVHLNDLLNPFLEKKIIIVINEDYLDKVLNIFVVKKYVRLRDEKNNLRDLALSSQIKILQRKLIFQGMEVSFETLIDTETQHFITPNILKTFSSNKTIKFGKSLGTSSYEQIKDRYVQRSLYRFKKIKTCNENNYLLSSLSKDESNASSQVQQELIKIKTLEEIKGTVVLLAEPGMGKSTLLTHLSIETQKSNPRIWIERVYLMELWTYEFMDFHKWQESKLKIDHVEALRFLCKSVICKKLTAHNEKINFDIEVINGILSLKSCNELDCLIQFELEMFIHYYNKGNTILIFDGFDEICPTCKDVVLQLLKCLAFKTFSKSGDNSSDNFVDIQKMWIIGRPYNNFKEILEAEFGILYSLKPYTDVEQNFCLERIFENKFEPAGP